MKFVASGTITVNTSQGQIEINSNELEFELEESYENPSGTENVVKATYDGDDFSFVVTVHEYPALIVSQQYVETDNCTLVSDDLSFEFADDYE